jgi:hypothetical protein
VYSVLWVVYGYGVQCIAYSVLCVVYCVQCRAVCMVYSV